MDQQRQTQEGNQQTHAKHFSRVAAKWRRRATPHPSSSSPAKKRPVPAKPTKDSASKKQKASASSKSNPVALGTPLITFPLATGLPKES
ncbi:hypothetical protein PF011_g23792 [Phytophthora fragariae]|uniref:Uncharacterized protein n=1 Tax=Phytophthora fragariae TaxID=53985 RepID=A0A6A3I4N9_9STRA|nr:hypothetical protein PF011_g23792 [Phytophthora fragariae]